MAIFELGLIRSFLLFPFIHPIFCSLKLIFIEKVLSDVNKNTNPVYLFILKSFLTHLILLFQIIPELISRFRQKRRNLEFLNSTYENTNLILRNYSNYNPKSFLLILLSTILFYSAIGNRTDDNFMILGRFSLLFCIAFWSYIILDIKIHSHQIIGIIFIIIGTIFLIILNIVNGLNSLNFLDVVFFISLYFIICLKYCISKFLLEIYFVSPFFILLIDGIFGLIIDSLITFFFILIDYFKINEIKILFNEIFNKKNNTLYLILYTLCEGITQTCIMITTFYFNPTMVGVSDYLSVFIQGIIKQYKWTYYIGYLLIIFGVFIYNEIIIFIICNLEFDTKKYITLRSSNDLDFDESLLSN